MDRLISLILVFAFGPTLALSQDQVPFEYRAETSVSAKAEIVSQSYCHNDDKHFEILMTVSMHITNVSPSPIILAKKIKDVPLLVRVSKTDKDLALGKYEYNPNMDEILTGDPVPPDPKFGGSVPSQYFIILKRGESYDFMTSSEMFGTTPPNENHDLLAAGNHVLQLGVLTWPYPRISSEAIRDLQNSWSNSGRLATGVVYSNFVPFTIPDNFSNPQCH